MTEDIKRIKSAKHLGDYRLLLIFSDGERRQVDLKDEVGGGVFEPLKDISFFMQVAVDPIAETICWPNGVDLCPESLYQWSKPA
jgi:hypothetical protein